jgi:hypothetical protein
VARNGVIMWYYLHKFPAVWGFCHSVHVRSLGLGPNQTTHRLKSILLL